MMSDLLLFENVLLSLLLLWGILSSLLYLRESDRRRDLATDMAQLVHDGKVSKEDLRRSKDHSDLQPYYDDE